MAAYLMTQCLPNVLDSKISKTDYGSKNNGVHFDTLTLSDYCAFASPNVDDEDKKVFEEVDNIPIFGVSADTDVDELLNCWDDIDNIESTIHISEELSEEERAINLKLAQRQKEIEEALDDMNDQEMNDREDLELEDDIEAVPADVREIIDNDEAQLGSNQSELDEYDHERTHFSHTDEIYDEVFDKIQAMTTPEDGIMYGVEQNGNSAILQHRRLRKTKTSSVMKGHSGRQNKETENKKSHDLTVNASPCELWAPLNINSKKLVLIFVLNVCISSCLCLTWFPLEDLWTSFTFLFLVVGNAIIVAFFILIKKLDALENDKKRVQKIKWTLQDFSTKIQDGLITSPSFKTYTGCSCKYCQTLAHWRLIIQRDTNCQTFNKVIIGLLAERLPNDMERMRLKITFSLIGKGGVDPKSCVEVSHCFQRSGDCAYTPPVELPPCLVNDGILIRCRLMCENYRSSRSEVMRTLCEVLEMQPFDGSIRHQAPCKSSLEMGEIVPFHPPKNVERPSPPESLNSVAEFINHCETQSFLWTIPCFEKHLKSTTSSVITFSPNLYVVSHGICSIWSLKLFEFQGIFRLHAKLVGLPTGVKRVKMNYVFQVQDSFGDFVIPDECGRRLHSGEYLQLEDFSRHVLYNRETLLERFVLDDGSLRLRISFNLEPLETDLTPEFADWILFQ